MARPTPPIYMGIISPGVTGGCFASPNSRKARKRMTRIKYLHIPDHYPNSGPAYVRVPVNGDELRRKIGKQNLIHKFSKKLSVREIERAAPAIIARFTAQVDGPDDDLATARKQLFDLADFAVSVRLLDDFEANLLPVMVARQRFQQWLESDDEIPTAPEVVPPPLDASPSHTAMKLAHSRHVYEWPNIIPEWETKRKQENKITSEEDRKDVRRIMGRLFKFLEHDDMNAVTGPDIDRYLREDIFGPDSKLGAGGYREHAIMLKSLFRLAFEKDLIDQNPTAGRLSYAKDTGRRDPFSDDQYRTVMQAARQCDDPIVRLPVLVEGMTGLRASEFVEASTADFRWEKGELKFVIQIKNRQGDAARLKSGGKTERFVVIHRSIRDDVWAHVQRRKAECKTTLFDLPVDEKTGKPKYGGRTGKMVTNRIGVWLHGIEGLELADDQSAHSLRHNVTSGLEKLASKKEITESLAEWLTHPPSNVRRKVYIHRDVEEVRDAINLLVALLDPFAERVAEAA